jgi:hypothetical protein
LFGYLSAAQLVEDTPAMRKENRSNNNNRLQTVSTKILLGSEHMSPPPLPMIIPAENKGAHRSMSAWFEAPQSIVKRRQSQPRR